MAVMAVVGSPLQAAYTPQLSEHCGFPIPLCPLYLTIL